MRKIDKDLTEIPAKLVVSDKQLTHQRRIELISKGAYIYESKYESRYKTPDIKEKLNNIYLHKCAYCENYSEQTHVDHYRPKKDYYWLAYSWDNLICSCPMCNQFKKNEFAIKGKRVSPPNATDDLSNINLWSSQKYDLQEKPLLLNPERDVLEDMFSFDKNGNIFGKNERAKYTIKICHLNRPSLVDARRSIIDALRNKVRAVLLGTENKEQKKMRIRFLVEDFVDSALDNSNIFTAFRKSAVKCLGDIVKEI